MSKKNILYMYMRILIIERKILQYFCVSKMFTCFLKEVKSNFFFGLNLE